MADQSVQTCITSPPYFGLRDYGVDGQIGLEATPGEFVARLVEVFREVRRLLRDDGTLWLNLGDTYRGGELLGIPWRAAFALQDDAWRLRQDVIWSKPNPMPESVKDRCTKAHEYLFLLSKSPDYYYDQVAIREPAAPSSIARWAQDVESQAGSNRVPGKTNGAMKAVGGRSKRDSFARVGAVAKHVLPGQSAAQHRADREDDTFDVASRNKRSVWTVPTMPFKGAHFATFPERLIEPCVLAGAPAGGVVLDPFMGTGTTAVVAERMGRRWVGCELNPKTAADAEARIRAVQPGLALREMG
jgi:DNA modification methylase